MKSRVIIIMKIIVITNITALEQNYFKNTAQPLNFEVEAKDSSHVPRTNHFSLPTHDT